MFKVIIYSLLGLVGVVVGVFYLDSFIRNSHVVTENSPEYTLDLKDIQYKGHTYIYVVGPYSHTLIHAEHCKCKK